MATTWSLVRTPNPLTTSNHLSYLASPLFSTHADCESNSDTSRDAHVRAGQQSNDSEAKLVEAEGIENIRFRADSRNYR